ncbi:MAG: cysteine--tRNA ligase [Bacteroidetes bacterium]|jgi:cysteinyl-tRNA synthetase|nr:cysteine--tRNA ligase [Bacteroidota bacterium]MBK8328160.1 cysteine--tRNA ligase [Bacteroidota bacterium]
MSSLYIYNSLTRQKEKFEPIHAPHVGMYVCGPTVYNDAHIGNVRTFSSFDMICRYLRYSGYIVRYVRNITDAGHLTNDRGEGVNRMESQAKLERLEPMEIVQKYTVGFHQVMALFNTLPPTIEPTATGHLIEQIDLIEQLIKNDFAYEVNGSVYFNVKKYNEQYHYGMLSGRNIDELIAGYRDLDGQEEKKHSIDFALWKKASPEHIMQWRSPWGMGFPGWHLECSAMSTKYLGQEFDIHGGGMDLKFPHHECEIAQNNGSHGHGGAKYWLHTNMLNFDGQKMSKSLGNAILPLEFLSGSHPLLDRGYSPMAIKFLFLQSHYSSELDINIKGLQDAEKGLKRLMDARKLLSNIPLANIKPLTEQTSIDLKIVALCEECKTNMDDDFNTAKTIACLFELSTIVNSLKDGNIQSNQLSVHSVSLLAKTFEDYLIEIFGLKPIEENNHGKLDDVLQVLINIRKEAKIKKDFATSDKIRNELLEKGVQLKDEKDGTVSWSI